VENYKFELIRADESQQITFVVTNRFQAVTAVTADQLLDGFVYFAAGCGFAREALLNSMQRCIEEDC
jgi:hypothetical protein